YRTCANIEVAHKGYHYSYKPDALKSAKAYARILANGIESLKGQLSNETLIGVLRTVPFKFENQSNSSQLLKSHGLAREILESRGQSVGE
ncbi:MAG: hypothetical protein KDA65_20085, partial [Planctomycetaceae bacterium]|nr:hypothetical protein [Planctomycetaceae bacterium]